MIVKYYNQMGTFGPARLPRSPVSRQDPAGRLSGRVNPVTAAHCRTARGCGVLAPIR